MFCRNFIQHNLSKFNNKLLSVMRRFIYLCQFYHLFLFILFGASRSKNVVVRCQSGPAAPRHSRCIIHFHITAFLFHVWLFKRASMRYPLVVITALTPNGSSRVWKKTSSYCLRRTITAFILYVTASEGLIGILPFYYTIHLLFCDRAFLFYFFRICLLTDIGFPFNLDLMSKY